MKEKFKKLTTMLLISCLLCINTNVLALTNSKWKTEQNKMTTTTSGILESEVEVIDKSENGKRRREYKITYTIPKDFNEDSIILVPNGYMNNCALPGDDDIFNIEIKNESENNYHYVNNSLILSTEDFDSYQDSEIGAHISNAYTFTDSKIREQIGFYRTKNTALQSLYGVNSTSKVTQEMLKDSEIDKILDKDKYPNGSKDLNKYYLDFYNQKYQTDAKVLEDLPTKAIAELFNGNYTQSFKETNQEVIELAYNFLYNKLLAFTFDTATINDENSELYSVASYMRKENSYKIANSILAENLNNIETDTTQKVNMPHVYINGKYMTNIYQNYYIGFYLEMRFEKDKEEPPVPVIVPVEPTPTPEVIKEDPIEIDYPLPPNTNCEE